MSARAMPESKIESAIDLAAAALLRKQAPEGYWCGELTADSTLESDYVLLQLWLHPPEESGWNPPTRRRIDRACRAILERQLPDGGWEIHPGGGSEINATSRAYAVLKICGRDPESHELARARERVLALGGLQSARVFRSRT